jgi:hypothetical protein
MTLTPDEIIEEFEGDTGAGGSASRRVVPRGRKPEARGRAGVRSQKSEVRSQESGVRTWGFGVRDSNAATLSGFISGCGRNLGSVL